MGLTREEKLKRKALKIEQAKATMITNNIPELHEDDKRVVLPTTVLAPMFIVCSVASFIKDEDTIYNDIVNITRVSSISNTGVYNDNNEQDEKGVWEINFIMSDEETVTWCYPDKLLRDADYFRLVKRFEFNYY